MFDDNAPITGVERGGKALHEGEQNEDMIGVAKIPLGELIKGASIHDRFPIKSLRNENCGQLEIKLTIMDMDSGFSLDLTKSRTAALHLNYNKQWENDIVYRIATKLARFPADVDMLFGIFSRG